MESSLFKPAVKTLNSSDISYLFLVHLFLRHWCSTMAVTFERPWCSWPFQALWVWGSFWNLPPSLYGSSCSLDFPDVYDIVRLEGFILSEPASPTLSPDLRLKENPKPGEWKWLNQGHGCGHNNWKRCGCWADAWKSWLCFLCVQRLVLGHCIWSHKLITAAFNFEWTAWLKTIFQQNEMVMP